MEKSKIDEFRNSISEVFYTVISENDFEDKRNLFFCNDTLSRFKKVIDNRLENNPDLNSISELKRFNNLAANLNQYLVQFFIGIYKFDEHDYSHIDNAYSNILIQINNIEEYELIIKKYYNKNEFAICIKVRNYCVELIKESFALIKNHIYLDLDISLFGELIKNLILKLQKSVKNKDVKLYFKLNKNKNLKLVSKTVLTGNSTKLTLRMLALKLVYEDEVFSKHDAGDKLVNTNFTSGDKLYNLWTFYRDTLNRQSDPQGLVKLKNKIKLFESVHDLLQDSKRAKVSSEIIILNNYIANYQ